MGLKMNEQKVKELILAAGAEYHFSGDIVVNHVETFAKKLIELTVNDCIQLANDEASRFYNMDEDMLGYIMENYREKLKEHFGVKSD